MAQRIGTADLDELTRAIGAAMLFGLAREHRESITWYGGVVVVAVGQRFDQLVAEARPGFEVAHAALIAEAGELLRQVRETGDVRVRASSPLR